MRGVVAVVDMCLYSLATMSPKELTAFRMDPEIMAGLRHVKERDGIPMAEQVHRALIAWLEQKGVRKKPARARKRSEF